MKKLIFILICVSAFILFTVSAEAQARQKRNKRDMKDKSPKIGDMAPDFELHLMKFPDEKDEKKDTADPKAEKPAPKAVEKKDTPDKKDEKKKEPEKVKLSSFRGKKPVVLLFGSYT
jgi:hypothetical protein